MAKAFKPSTPYSTAIELYIPTYTTVKGVQVKAYPAQGIRLNCSFKTYGGTETSVNDAYSVVNTAHVETWYRPDIAADCMIKVLQTGQTYEVINQPENIDMRNQFCRFKVQSVEGGA